MDIQKWLVAVLLFGATAMGQHTPAEMDALLAKIATYEHGQSREALGQFQELVFDSMGAPAQLRQLEARLVKFIEAGPTPAARSFAFDQLTYVVTEASVAKLSLLLERSETAEPARFLLERIPGPAASDALRKRLKSATGNARIGLINSLGRRRDTASVPLLATMISPADKAIAEAALAALQSISDPASTKALAAARSKLDGELREEASEAYAECADRLAKQGQSAAAVRIYRELITPRESAGVRIRAMAGLVNVDGSNALPMVVAAIHSKDPREQNAALAFLDRIPGAASTKAMMAEFPKLSAPGQVRILAALADRADAAAMPLALAALKNNSGDVRAAGFAALGKLGNESAVMLLAEAAAERPGPEQEAARQSLWALRAAGVDPAIVGAIGSKTGKVRTELIAAAGERGTVGAADALGKAVGDSDPEVQGGALRALRNVGGSPQVPVLLQFLLQSPSAASRREATRTLSAVLKRSDAAMIDKVLEAYPTSPSIESRVSLLEVMGQTSSASALPLLRRSLKDQDPEIVRGAILALTNWQTVEPLEDLHAIAKDGQDATARILALRGYMKLIGLPAPRPPSESARMLSEAVALAKEPAEKRIVLSMLPAYPCPESLQIVEGLLRDETVANEAKIAAGRLRAAMRQR